MRKVIAGEGQVFRHVRAHDPRQPNRAAGAGNQSVVRVRVTDARGARSDHDVAGEQQFKSAGQRQPVHPCDHRLFKCGKAFDGPARVGDEFDNLARIDLAGRVSERLQVSARAEARPVPVNTTTRTDSSDSISSSATFNSSSRPVLMAFIASGRCSRSQTAVDGVSRGWGKGRGGLWVSVMSVDGPLEARPISGAKHLLVDLSDFCQR